MNTEYAKRLTIEHGLDCGGYEFEPWEAFSPCVVAWDDPDFDYLTGDHPAPDHRWEPLVFVFAPNTGHFGPFEFPDTHEEIDGDGDAVTYRKVAEGWFNQGESECHCHGRMVAHSGAAGEPRKPLDPADVERYAECGVELQDKGCPVFFEHTGNVSDAPYPDCHRCDGDGYINQTGGEWAVYVMEWDDE